MNQRSQTPDERFLISLYQAAKKKGDLFAPFDSREIARSVGLKETALKNIVKHLAQANFVKKVDPALVYLTQRGCDFVIDELSQRSV